MSNNVTGQGTTYNLPNFTGSIPRVDRAQQAAKVAELLRLSGERDAFTADRASFLLDSQTRLVSDQTRTKNRDAGLS